MDHDSKHLRPRNRAATAPQRYAPGPRIGVPYDVRKTLAGDLQKMSRVIALDHGEARCGVAISDPTGELATPLAAVNA